MEKKKNTPTAIKLEKVQTEIRKTREKLNKLVTEEKKLTTLYQTEIMQTTSDYLKDFFKSGTFVFRMSHFSKMRT